MKTTTHETENLSAPFLTGMALAVVLSSMVALSTPAFAMGGGGGSVPAPKVTKVDDPVVQPKDEVAEVRKPVIDNGGKTPVDELRTKEPEEKTLTIEDPDEGKTETKPDERTTDFPEDKTISKPDVVIPPVEEVEYTTEVIVNPEDESNETIAVSFLKPATIIDEGGTKYISIGFSPTAKRYIRFKVNMTSENAEWGEDYRFYEYMSTGLMGEGDLGTIYVSSQFKTYEDEDTENEVIEITIDPTSLPQNVVVGEIATHTVTIVDNDSVADVDNKYNEDVEIENAKIIGRMKISNTKSISIKNGHNGIINGDLIASKTGDGDILIENRGSIGTDTRIYYLNESRRSLNSKNSILAYHRGGKGDIAIQNYGLVANSIEANHYGDGEIRVENTGDVRNINLRHFGKGIVRFNGNVTRLNITGNYRADGVDNTQLIFDTYSVMTIDGNVTGQSRVLLDVDADDVYERTHFWNIIGVSGEVESDSFVGEQVIGAFKYVLENVEGRYCEGGLYSLPYDCKIPNNSYQHVWSFVNKGLSDTAKKASEIPDNVKDDLKPVETKEKDEDKKFSFWGGLDSSHMDIGLGFPAFVPSDDYYVGSQVQYYLKDDRTGIRASVETEYNFDIMSFRITPHARLTWTRVGFEDFVGPHRERISLVDGDTVDLRLGLSFDNEYQFSDGFASVYGGLFMQTPIDGKTSVKVSGVTIASERNDMVVDGKLGFSYEWDEGYAVYGEATAVHRDDADEVRANLGVRIDF